MRWNILFHHHESRFEGKLHHPFGVYRSFPCFWNWWLNDGKVYRGIATSPKPTRDVHERITEAWFSENTS